MAVDNNDLKHLLYSGLNLDRCVDWDKHTVHVQIYQLKLVSKDILLKPKNPEAGCEWAAALDADAQCHDIRVATLAFMQNLKTIRFLKYFGAHINETEEL